MIAYYENSHISSNLNSNVFDSDVLIGIKNLFCLTRGLQAAHKSVQMTLARDCRTFPKI